MKPKTLLILSLIPAMAIFYGCDRVYRMLDKGGAEEKELVGEILPFEDNEKVKEIQALLKVYGYSPGSVDGVLGPSTREAIAKFQKDQGLEITRSVSLDTWQKLNVFTENGLVKDGELNLIEIQQLLFAAGYNPGKIDGKIGPSTHKAIKAFQKGHNVHSDGKIGYKTLTLLAKYLKKTRLNNRCSLLIRLLQCRFFIHIIII